MLKNAESVATVGAITSFKAVKANVFEAKFESAQPDGVTVKITKDNVDQTGEIKWSDDKTSFTFTAAAKFSNGEYVLTATKGESSQTAKTTVTDEKVQEIKILCDSILTGKDNTEGYIYYRVNNQYEEDITATVDVQWTISSSKETTVDPSKGKITINSGDGETFKYGTDIMIVGVYAADGVTVQETRKIGMEQAIAGVEVRGFVNYKAAKVEEAVETLPVDFAKDTWSMIYDAYDQNGMPLDAVKYDSKNITFISNNPLLLQSDFEADKLYTLKDKETGKAKQYAAVKVQPGDYSDQGGEVTIMAISSKAGTRKEITITIGKNARLKSLTIIPSTTVTDGEKNVTLNYVAKDMDGNDVTSYETIARSSNSLKLNASPGVLRVEEGNDGKAVIKWSDEDVKFEESRSHDGITRIVSLTTVVVGGESQNVMMYVKDKKRPVAFKSVEYGLDKNDAMVVGNNVDVDLFSDKVVYVDQYGYDMKGADAKAFFDYASKNEFDGKLYTIRVQADDDSYLTVSGQSQNLAEAGTHKYDNMYVDAGNNTKVNFKAIDTDNKELDNGTKAGTTNVTYSIATKTFKNNQFTGLVDKGNTLVQTYTTVPQSMAVADVEAAPKNTKYLMRTSNTVNANGSYLSNDCFVASKGGIVQPVVNEDNGNTLTLSGADVGYTVKGKVRRLNNISLTLPAECVTIDNINSEIVAAGTGLAVSQGAIKWSELYNDNDAKRLRIDAKKTLALIIKDANNTSIPESAVKTTFTVSDCAPAPIKLVDGFVGDVNPTATVLGFGMRNNVGKTAKIVDQYGNDVTGQVELSYNVTLTEEATNAFTHLGGSFEILKNNTGNTTVRGAELGDKYKVVTSVSAKGSKAVAFTFTNDVTVGADRCAWISSADNDNDMKWRKANNVDANTGVKSMIDGNTSAVTDGLGLGMNR